MQFCPQSTAAWRGNPRLPSRACGFSSVLMSEAYRAAGQATSALHTKPLLLVYQAKALKQLHEGSSDPGLMQGDQMSTLVVRERHIWLNLADMRESDKQPLPRLPNLPGWPLRRRTGELCPTVIRCTEADRGGQTHPAPAGFCCHHPAAGCSPSACSSPRARSCCLHLHSSPAPAAAFTTAAASGQAASLGSANLRLWIPLLRRW